MDSPLFSNQVKEGRFQYQAGTKFPKFEQLEAISVSLWAKDPVSRIHSHAGGVGP